MTDKNKGIILVLMAALCYALGSILVKIVAKELPLMVVLFFRFFFALLLFLPFIIRNKSFSLKIKHVGLLSLRVVSWTIATSCFYFAVKYLKVSTTMLLFNTSPIFIVIITFFWFRQKINFKGLVGIFVAFLGVVLILKPSNDFYAPALFIGLFGGFLFGLGTVATKRFLQKEGKNKVNETIFYYLLFSTIVFAIFLPFSWKALTFLEFIIFILIGIFTMFYQVFLTKSLNYITSKESLILLYFAIFFGALFDIFLFNLKFTVILLFGMVTVIIGGIIAISNTDEKMEKI